jgi:phage shock protein A
VAILTPMGIIGRAQSVLASNFNALISRFEEPGRDIALLVGEMKEQLRAAEHELIRMMGERKRSDGKLAELDEAVQKWEKRAELAVRSGDDGLAREALAQKQRVMVERDQVSANRAAQQHAAVGMKAEIERMKRVHQDYAARQHTIATQVSQSRAGGGATGLGARPGASNFDAFERIEQAIDSDEAKTAAGAEIDQMLNQTALGTMTRDEMDDEFRKLEQTAAVAGEGPTGETPSSNEGEQKPRVRIEP